MNETKAQRKLMAETLIRVRRADRGVREEDEDYLDYRDFYGYLAMLDGLRNFLDYARKLDPHPLVLDLGAGETLAAAQLEKSSFGKDLVIEAITLTRKKAIENNLGFDKTHITSIERMHGIRDNSVSAMISVNGLAYSSFPELAVESIDRVLVPGGSIKAFLKFPIDRQNVKPLEESRQTPHRFSKALTSLGYDVGMSINFMGSVLLGIKPGGSITASAKDLLDADMNTDANRWYDEQKSMVAA